MDIRVSGVRLFSRLGCHVTGREPRRWGRSWGWQVALETWQLRRSRLRLSDTGEHRMVGRGCLRRLTRCSCSLAPASKIELITEIVSCGWRWGLSTCSSCCCEAPNTHAYRQSRVLGCSPVASRPRRIPTISGRTIGWCPFGGAQCCPCTCWYGQGALQALRHEEKSRCAGSGNGPGCCERL